LAKSDLLNTISLLLVLLLNISSMAVFSDENGIRASLTSQQYQGSSNSPSSILPSLPCAQQRFYN